MDYGVGKKNGIVYANDAFPTPVGRFTWVNVAQRAQPFKGKDGTTGDAKFQITLLIEKNKTNNAFIDKIEAIAGEMLDEYNKNCKKFGKPKLAEITAVRDGDNEDLEKYPYYENMWVIRSSNKNEIVCFDKNKDVLEDKSAILGGCIGRLVVSMSLGSFGVSFRCENVQLIKDDGTRFGGGIRDHSALLTAVDDEGEETDDEETTEEDTKEGADEDGDELAESEEDTETSEEDEEESPPLAAKKRGRPQGSGKKSIEDIRANALSKRKGKAAVADIL